MGGVDGFCAGGDCGGVSGFFSGSVAIEAPAKLNLGLEVIGRREDGFHEIATVFLAIDLYDTLTLGLADGLEVACADPALAGGENLALSALRELRDETGYDGGARVELVKYIPVASGLGGASSDAAAALRGGCALWGLDVGDDALHAIAARLGSDVPFFLHGGCAVGRGRGDEITTLPMPGDVWFVVVVPTIVMSNKTANLYAQLRVEDFSDSAQISAQAARLKQGLGLDPGLLGNAFARPLSALVPALVELPGVMREAGAATVAISGAGPAHYAPFGNPDEARRVAKILCGRLRERAQVFVSQPALNHPGPATRL